MFLTSTKSFLLLEPHRGVNVVPFLEMIGFPESIVGLMRDSSSGYALTAYAMFKVASTLRFGQQTGLRMIQVWLSDGIKFKSSPLFPLQIATPARYAVTLGGTSLSIQYLRKHGYLSTPPPVTDYLQDKMEATKERFTEKMEETKGLISEKMEETKDKLSEKLQETKDRVSEGKSFFRKKND